jgi:lipoprotein-releasing system permease protein
MNLEPFIVKRLFFPKNGSKRKSGTAVRIAVIGITVGLAVMLLAVAVVLGFKREVRDKIIGVGSHIQITSYYSNYTYEMSPVNVSDSMISRLDSIPGVRHVQRMFTKPGMIKTNTDFQAVVFKGADEGFDKKFISDCMIEGTFPDYSKPSNEVLIPEYISKLLDLKLGDSFLAYFVKDEYISARKFKVSGIFNTHFSGFDKLFMIADSRHIQHLNQWDSDQAGGLEIFFSSMDNFDKTEDAVFETMSKIASEKDEIYYLRNLYEMNPDLFGWLDLLDMNVLLILLLMIFVSGFNIISGLLILILERTNMIGILKALGANNKKIRRIFTLYSTLLIGRGLIWGNLIGLSFCFIQKYFHVFKLDPSIYYVESVPIELNIWYVLALNVGTILVSLAVVMIPSALVSHIHPVKAIKFE